MNRQVHAIYPARPAVDGDGVKIQRISTQQRYPQFDPFLMLDEFKGGHDGKPVRGFPEHPHRGFETVSYMLDGAIEHRDHMGNVGRLVSGGVQWMTAGRGVIHSEMPIADDSHFHGFQLWVNLPAAEKMTAARYREFGPESIPVVQLEHGHAVKVIAGTLEVNGQTVTGPVQDVATHPDYWDITVGSQAPLTLAVASRKTLLLYVYQGSASIGERVVSSHHMAVLSQGETLEIGTENGARLLLLAAEPIGEPVASYGPFVMNTHEEIEQAIRDYNHGTLI